MKHLRLSIYLVSSLVLLLICTALPFSKARAEEDDAVEIPDSIRVAASGITITGTPGPSQDTLKLQAKIQRLNVDTHGHLAKGNLDYDLFMTFPLDLRLPGPAGKYYVGYSNGFNIVDLAVGEDKVIHLKPLTIPKTDGNSKFKVFLDTTATEEQDKEMLFYWLIPNILTFNVVVDDGGGHTYKWQEKTSQVELCRKAKMLPTGKKFCAALLGSDYKAMAPFYKFNSDGTMMSYAGNFKINGLENKTYDLFYVDAALARVETTLKGYQQENLVDSRMQAFRYYVDELLFTYRQSY